MSMFSKFARFSGQAAWINALVFSPNEKYLASGGSESDIRIRGVPSGEDVQRLIGHNDWIAALAYSPDGKSLASGSADRTVKLWDTASGLEIHTFTEHENEVVSVAFSPDGRYLLSASRDYSHSVKVWDLQSYEAVQTEKADSGGGIPTVVFHPSGAFWACSTKPLTFDASGRFLAIAQKETVTIWDLTIQKPVQILGGNCDMIFSLTYSPDSRNLVGACVEQQRIRLPDGKEYSRELNSLILWDVSSGNIIQALEEQTGFIKALSFCANGKYLTSGSLDGTIVLWETENSNRLNPATKQQRPSIQFTDISEGFIPGVVFYKITCYSSIYQPPRQNGSQVLRSQSADSDTMASQIPLQ